MKIQPRTLALIAASLCTACGAPDDPPPPGDHRTASESARAGNQKARTLPGRIELESLLPDGTLSGLFSNVSLPHVGKELPNVVLTDGRFTVRLDMP